MNYINLDTQEFPVTETQIRLAHPHNTFPVEFVAPENFALVVGLPKPDFDAETQRVERKTNPNLQSGTWYLGWNIIDLTAEEIEAKLAAERTPLIAQIKAVRDTKIQTGGIKISRVIDLGEGMVENFTKWFHTDTFSRTQYMALVMMGDQLPTGIQWKTMDGSFVEITQSLVAEIFNAIAIKDATIFAFAESKIAQVNASSTPVSVDIASGWPVSFS